MHDVIVRLALLFLACFLYQFITGILAIIRPPSRIALSHLSHLFVEQAAIQIA